MELRASTPSGATETRHSVSSAYKVSIVSKATPPAQLYTVALNYARDEQYRAGRVLFERLLRANPTYCKAWVSYAMMEKRAGDREQRFDRCRQVLQRGLTLNPSSACLIQAWGLMELQRGSYVAALLLLERSVRLDPRLQPVLNWTQVATARQTVGSRKRTSSNTC